MSNIQIIVGSMLGGTEYVAEACEEEFKQFNQQSTVHFKPDFQQIPTENQLWVICTSTHGAGDYPDNIQQFVTDLDHCDQDLSTTKFMVIATGDSNYDTFCLAGFNIEKLLISKGCIKLNNIKTLDMNEDIDPEDLAATWIRQHIDQVVHTVN